MKQFSALVLTLSFLSPSILALIPKQCAPNITWTASVCCPTPQGFDSPCGYPRRGKCEKTQGYHQILKRRYLSIESHDIRMYWPTRLYSHSCECRPRFWGPDCGECWFGYSGANCNKRVLRKRRNILTYSKAEKRQLIDILVKARQIPSNYVIPLLLGDTPRWSGRVKEVDNYELINFVHWLGSMPVITENEKTCARLDLHVSFDTGHADVGFPFYHRYVLLLLERLLSPIAEEHFGVKNFALPYWDWTDSRQCDICTDSLLGTESREWNPIRKCNFISPKSPLGSNITWPVHCQQRHLHQFCAPCNLSLSETSRLCRSWKKFNFPTVDEVIKALQITKLYDHSDSCRAFVYVMEGGGGCSDITWWKDRFTLHGKVHVLTSGTMLPPVSSVYDPFFVIHHVQTDRLYERWQRNLQPSQREMPNVNVNEPMCRDCNVAPFFPVTTFKDLFVDSRALGYTYNNLDFGPLSEKVQIGHWNSVRTQPHLSKEDIKEIIALIMEFLDRRTD